MRIFKKLYILSTITILFLSTDINSISLGKFWHSIHANSLIGMQKIFENLNSADNNINYWFHYIIPILEIKLLFILAILMFLFFFKNLKKK